MTVLVLNAAFSFRYYSVNIFNSFLPPLPLPSTDGQVSSSPEYTPKEALTLQLLTEPPISRVHCLGDTFSDTPHAAIFRSCRYDNLCYDTQERQFVEYPSANHWNLRSTVHANIHLSSIPKSVMLSPVSVTGEADSRSSEDSSLWTPVSKYRRQEAALSTSASPHQYYMMDGDNIVWIPIQLCLKNHDEMTHGQIFFDSLLPIYTLLEIFDLREKRIMLILMGDYENEDTRASACLESVIQLAELMAISRSDIVSVHDLHNHIRPAASTHDRERSLASPNKTVPMVVCNTISVAGIGAHASHGVPQSIVNVSLVIRKGIPPTRIRRALNLRGFRRFLLGKMKMPDPERSTPHRVVFSSSISLEIIKAVRKALPQDIELSQMSTNSTVYQQIKVLRNVTAFVCFLREDTPGAFFLPTGATLIMIREPADRRGHPEDGINSAAHWNFWNNNALVRTHLLDGKNTRQQVLVMEYLIRDELDRLRTDLAIVTHPTTATKGKPVQFAGRLATLVHARPPATQVHCLGEKLFPSVHGADKFRSCHFENLCFDLETKSFVAFPSENSELLRRLPSDQNYFSSIAKNMHGVPNGFPPVANRSNVSSYYQIDGIWLAMQTINTCNPGHILWDSWLPLFALLGVFGLEKEALLISRYRGKSDCPRLNQPLEADFGFPNRTARHDALLTPDAQSTYVCGRHSAMGIGWMNDHGVSKHGWDVSDLAFPVNIGRGPEIQRFRARLLQQMGITDIDPVELRSLPPQVLFLRSSSRHKRRQLNFRESIQSLKEFIPGAHVSEVNVDKPLNFKDMALIARNVSIYISAVGGATASALFLPRGASLILYGDKDMYLDFDLFNNFGHLRVHWLSVASREKDTLVLNELVRDELGDRVW